MLVLLRVNAFVIARSSGAATTAERLLRWTTRWWLNDYAETAAYLFQSKIMPQRTEVETRSTSTRAAAGANAKETAIDGRKTTSIT